MNRGGIFARARLWCLAALSGVVAWMPVELQALPPQVEGKATASPLSVFTIPPQRVVWTTPQGVSHAAGLPAASRNGQALLSETSPPLVLAPGAAVLLDFGVEIAGSLELVTAMTESKEMPEVRVRFGESAAEAMAEPGERGAQNDHALRDQTVRLPWLGKTTIGPSGFRFARIDHAAGKEVAKLSQVRALMTLRDVPWLGSFRCSDERLERIWRTGAWTVHLNMQDYLWDGIKRDRLVWLGDMHPEVSVIQCVFGHNDVVPRSLDLIRTATPVKEWMNGISSYSMWWVLIHEDWYRHHGDLAYLRAQRDYLTALLRKLAGFVDEQGRETLDGMRFLDWPTFENKQAVHEGLQAMMALTMDSGARLCTVLGDESTAALCRTTLERLRRHQVPPSGRKSPAALLSLAGLRDPAEVSQTVLKRGGPVDLSTFYGYYVLEALAKSDDTETALDFIRRYWGGMLDFGATTFWEDFDLAWTKDAGRIDELVPPGKKDLHGDFGAHCYVGFRHSLCHGWAGGPTAWLSRHVLGITPAEPGFTAVRIRPMLGDLAWAEGTYPTPKGLIRVRHERRADGTIDSTVHLPEGVRRVD